MHHSVQSGDRIKLACENMHDVTACVYKIRSKMSKASKIVSQKGSLSADILNL